MRKRSWLAVLLTLALLVTMLPGIALGAPGSSVPFWDVQGGPYETPVKALYDIGVVSGTSATTYSPGDKVTRAQMAALLVRALNLADAAKQESFKQKFTDVPPSHWAFGTVMLAEARGIVRGYDNGTFNPGGAVTYPQAVTMALRALGHDNGTLDYPAGYVLLGKDLGLIEGLNWDLNGEMTRGEVAVLLANAVFKVKHKDLQMTLSQRYFRRATSLEIRPGDTILTAGATQLEAVGKDAYGMELGPVSPKWQITAGSASITAGGLLSTTKGQVTVEASVGDLVVARTYQVLSGVRITPAAEAVKPGQELTLKLVSADNPNTEVAGANWSVVSGPGTIKADGRLSITGAGTVSVKATVGTLQATATFTSIAGLKLEPQDAMLTPGESVKFSVKTPDGQPYTGPIQWTVEGVGTITSDGTFTAAAGGTPVVRAKAGDLSATAPVKVVHRLVVSPSGSVAVVKSKTQQFTAKGITTTGEEVELPIKWSYTGKMGIVGADGLFVATTPGTGTVTASYGKLSQTVNISVSGEPYSVTLAASRVSVPANGRSPVTLTATLKDINGIVVNTETNISFLLSDGTRGTLSATTVKTQNGVATVTFTPSTTTGTVRVTAAASDLAVLIGYVDLTATAPVPSKIVLSASPNPVASAANSRATIYATLVDSEGYEIMNTSGTTQAVTLSFTNTTAASLSANVIYISPMNTRGQVDFIAGNPGDITIHGAATWPVQSVTVRTLIAGPAVRVGIRPGLTETKADGSTDMLVYAEIQDANGVVRTQDYAIPITLTIVSEDGLTTLPAQVMSTVSGVATFRVRTTKAGKFTFTASASTLQSGTAVGTFVPGAASGLRLSAVPTADVAADGISTVKVRAEIVDVNGNPVTSAAGSITLVRTTNQNATALPAATTVTAAGGVAEFVLTSTVYPGQDTLKATMPGMADSNNLQITSRITGVPAKVVAQINTASTTVGGKIPVTVYVQDSRNQTVTSANNRTVRVVPNSPTATVTGSGLTQGGVATFYISDSAAGVVSLSVTSEGLQSDNTKAVQFTSGPAAKVALKVTSNEISVDAGASYVQLSAEVQDAYGNRVNQTIPVTLSVDRNDVITLSSTQLYTGNYVLVRSTSLPGAATITGTSSVPVTGVTVQTFIPGNPSRVVVEPVTTGPAGTPIQVKVKVIDHNGHVLTSLNTGGVTSAMGIMVTGSAGNTQTITNNNLYLLGSFQGNGVSNGSVAVSGGVATFTYNNPKAESVTLTPVLYHNGVALQAVPGTVTTTPGNAVKLSVRSNRTGLSSAGGDSAIIEAVLLDAFDNPVAISGQSDTFTFSFSTTGYVSTGDPTTVPTSTAKATIQVTSLSHGTGGATTITATSAKTGYSGSVTVVTDRTPSAPILFVTDANGTDAILQPGETAIRLVVTVEARNSNQTIQVYVDGVQVNLYANSSGGALNNTVLPGQTTLVGFVLRSDLGAPGTRSIRVVVQNAVAPSPMSNPQTVTIQ